MCNLTPPENEGCGCSVNPIRRGKHNLSPVENGMGLQHKPYQAGVSQPDTHQHRIVNATWTREQPNIR